ncbi:hypothetical protein FDUTEX481_02107 [Tolypothrix sp. PCC 7601]|nr:hypothetical protein FDUTEX481_02107 [Tolypothrix sp. PCC 7601]
MGVWQQVQKSAGIKEKNHSVKSSRGKLRSQLKSNSSLTSPPKSTLLYLPALERQGFLENSDERKIL